MVKIFRFVFASAFELKNYKCIRSSLTGGWENGP